MVRQQVYSVMELIDLCDFLGYVGSKTVALVDHQANDPKSTFNYVVDGAGWTIGRAAELGVDVADYGNRFFSGFVKMQLIFFQRVLIL